MPDSLRYATHAGEYTQDAQPTDNISTAEFALVQNNTFLTVARVSKSASLRRSKSLGDLDTLAESAVQAPSAESLKSSVPGGGSPVADKQPAVFAETEALPDVFPIASGSLQEKSDRVPAAARRKRDNRRRHTAHPAPETHPCTGQVQEDINLASTITAVLETSQANLASFDFVLSVSAVHALAKLADGISEDEKVRLKHAMVFQELVARMHAMMPQVRLASDAGKHLTDALYSLGKLEAIGFHVLIKDISQLLTEYLHQCSPVEMSTALWSLAKLVPCELGNNSATYPAKQLAQQLITQLTSRSISRLTPHCISEAMWARARLELQGKQVQVFMDACKVEICTRPSLNDFSTQGLANTAWAIAKSINARNPSQYYKAGQASLRIIQSSLPRLHEFEALELSMSAWAAAKIHARSEGNLLPESIHEVGSFVEAIAAEVLKRFRSLSVQSISNVGWALSKLDRMAEPSGRAFFEAAVQAVIEQPMQFSPQAISNLCYAVSWLNSKSRGRLPPAFRDAMTRFGEVAAHQALTREHDFKWQDLSGVLVGIAPRHSHDVSPLGQGPYTKHLAERLASRVAHQGRSLTTQVGLNIAVAASRVGIPVQVLDALFQTMSSVIAQRTPNLNNNDMRQYRELQNRRDNEMEKASFPGHNAAPWGVWRQ